MVLFFVEEGAEGAAGKRLERPPMFDGISQILTMPALLALIACIFGIQASSMMVSPIFPLFVQALIPGGENVASAVGFILGVSGIVTAIAALAIGRVSDRLGHRKVLAVCAVGAGFSYLPTSLCTDPNQVLLLRALLGLFVGGMLPSANALIALRAPEGAQGAAFGLSATSSSLGSALGPLLGAGLATQLGLRSVFVAAGMLLISTGSAAAAMRTGRPGRARSRPGSGGTAADA